MSDQFDAFYADLELLYIVGNASGRIKFAQAWPAAAAFIFGDELIDYDQNGVQNRERLLELEEDAEIRRGVLLETFETIEQQSADKGSLRTDFVGSVVRDLGEHFALHIYNKPIIDRVLRHISPQQTSTNSSVFKNENASSPAGGSRIESEQPERQEMPKQHMTFVPAKKEADINSVSSDAGLQSKDSEEQAPQPDASPQHEDPHS